jgi:predicted permease
MTSQPASRPRPASGGTGLLVTISAATIVTVALEAGFVAIASWALLPAIVLVIVVMAALVVRAVVRVIDDGAVADARPAARPEREAVEEPTLRRAPSIPALGH